MAEQTKLHNTKIANDILYEYAKHDVKTKAESSCTLLKVEAG